MTKSEFQEYNGSEQVYCGLLLNGWLLSLRIHVFPFHGDFMKFLFTESGLQELLHIFPHLSTFSIMIEQSLQWQEKAMPDSLLS
jgi:hypothetical protein